MATKHSGNTIAGMGLERFPHAARLMARHAISARSHAAETVMLRKQATIISDAARAPSSSSAGDLHDVTRRHRYYGSSAVNGGERITETRRGPRPQALNLFGF
jgi:hypothetical protein